VKLLQCVFCSSEWRFLFIAVGGQWSVEAVEVRHGCTYDVSPFVIDGPDARSLVGCESVLLTPKICTRKRLTCGPSLVGEYHSAKGFPQSIR
jgi:hypothetical protein